MNLANIGHLESLPASLRPSSSFRTLPSHPSRRTHTRRPRPNSGVSRVRQAELVAAIRKHLEELVGHSVDPRVDAINLPAAKTGGGGDDDDCDATRSVLQVLDLVACVIRGNFKGRLGLDPGAVGDADHGADAAEAADAVSIQSLAEAIVSERDVDMWTHMVTHVLGSDRVLAGASGEAMQRFIRFTANIIAVSMRLSGEGGNKGTAMHEALNMYLRSTSRRTRDLLASFGSCYAADRGRAIARSTQCVWWDIPLQGREIFTQWVYDNIGT